MFYQKSVDKKRNLFPNDIEQKNKNEAKDTIKSAEIKHGPLLINKD